MELPKRKNIRLKDYDYSQNGAYFVTICTHNRENLFGEIYNGIMNLSLYGQIAQWEIMNTNDKRLKNDIYIDKFIVMPNHVHIIINVGSWLAVTANTNAFSKPIKNSLSAIVGGYKSAVTRKINESSKTDMASHVPTVWQSRYHDHIIRNEKEYLKNMGIHRHKPIKMGK